MFKIFHSASSGKCNFVYMSMVNYLRSCVVYLLSQERLMILRLGHREWQVEGEDIVMRKFISLHFIRFY